MKSQHCTDKGNHSPHQVSVTSQYTGRTYTDSCDGHTEVDWEKKAKDSAWSQEYQRSWGRAENE